LTRTAASPAKDLPLEALRGLAAITVLLWHSMLGFFPQWSGAFPQNWPQELSLNGQVWFGLIHGTAAVTLFFVLSGFVLTRRYLLTGDQQIILRGAIKRWPRLAGPVLITVLISWLLFKLGAYHFEEGGAVTGSPWLSKFAYAFDVPFEPNFWRALLQGSFLTFFKGDSYYDSSLWTMRYEFIGSFIAFGLALLIALPAPSRLFRPAIIGVIYLLCQYAAPVYAAFPAGVALAAFLPEREIKLRGLTFGGFVLVAIYLLGFTGNSNGVFFLVSRLFGSGSTTNIHILASVLLIVSIERAPDTIRQRLSGRFAKCLGTISFPLYLIHVLVLCSLGCDVLIWARTWTSGFYPNIVAGIVTILGSILAAIPLAIFNERWVTLVNTATNWFMAPESLQKPTKKNMITVE